jgi:hypothetical protein
MSTDSQPESGFYPVGEIARRSHEQITEFPAVVSYLSSRGVGRYEIDRWQIGMCSDDRTPMYGRITIPIMDWCGNVLSVAGRAIGELEPKYWHYSFAKERVLFGLPHGRPAPHVVLVEGAMDVILLDKLGLVSLGVMGSEMSPQQAALLTRWTDTAVVYPDSDRIAEAAKWVRVLEQTGIRAAMPPRPYPPDLCGEGMRPDPADLARLNPKWLLRQVEEAAVRVRHGAALDSEPERTV